MVIGGSYLVRTGREESRLDWMVGDRVVRGAPKKLGERDMKCGVGGGTARFLYG